MSEDVETAPNIYTGLNEQHGVRWVETGWATQSGPEFPESISKLDVDDCVANIVSECIDRGEKEITVVDIGSGSEGYFIKAFLSKDEFPKLHQLLGKKSGLSLRIVGITAAQEGKEQGFPLIREEQEIETSETTMSKVVVENYGYTITKAHTLTKFLKEKEIENINASFSTFGIGYFTPKNFEQCLTDVADSLAPGGKFYGVTWDAVPAGAERGLFGLFNMRANLKSGHPLNKVFGGFGNNDEYKRFYDLSPSEQVDAHLEAIDFALSRELISLEQARHIFLDRDVLPLHAFVRNFHHYTDQAQHQKVLKRLSRYAKKFPWVSQIDWTGGEGLFSSISNAQSADNLQKKERKVASKNPLSKAKWLRRQKKSFYQEGRTVEEGVWSFIEKKYAVRIRKNALKEKDRVDLKIPTQSWEEIKQEIQNANPTIVAEFWDWDGIYRDFEELFISRQSGKTTKLKQAALETLSQRDNLEVYSSSVPDGHGLNVYIGKIKK